jgi:hypothetical protein
MLLSCQKEVLNDDPYSYPQKPRSAALANQNWLVVKYQNTSTMIEAYPNDTLYFENDSLYRINSGSSRSYRLQESINLPGRYFLQLDTWTTLGGSYIAYFDPIFIEDGELNNISFDNMNTPEGAPNDEVLVWLELIN